MRQAGVMLAAIVLTVACGGGTDTTSPAPPPPTSLVGVWRLADTLVISYLDSSWAHSGLVTGPTVLTRKSIRQGTLTITSSGRDVYLASGALVTWTFYTKENPHDAVQFADTSNVAIPLMVVNDTLYNLLVGPLKMNGVRASYTWNLDDGFSCASDRVNVESNPYTVAGSFACTHRMSLVRQ